MKHVQADDVKPCAHMRVLVSAEVDNRLPKILSWYTKFHIRDCPQCQASIPFLVALKGRLASLNALQGGHLLDEKHKLVVEQSWSEIDTAVSGKEK